MATLARTPIPAPTVDYRAGREAWQRQEQAYLDELAVKAWALGTGDLVGGVIRFPVADGYAQYVVARTAPLTLWHVELGDGYSIQPAHMRGLRLSDVEVMVEHDRRWKALMDERKVAF